MDTACNGIEAPSRWSLRLFSDFALSKLPGDEKVQVPGKRERVLLAYLALSPNCRQPRRRLVTLLWGDATDTTSLDNLRTCVWNLRKALGDTERRIVSSEGRDIVLNAAAFEVDVLAFRNHAAQSGRIELEEAAKLHTGEFLDGLSIESEEFESWRRDETTRCRDQALDVRTRLMTQLAELGETERAIDAGLGILRFERLHEPTVRRLMRLYGGSGRRGAAVQLYRTFSDALSAELNARPEADTRAVYAEIARGGDERTEGAAAAHASLPPRPMNLARPSASIAGSLRPPPPPAFQFRAPLTLLVGALIVAATLVSYRQFEFSSTPAGVVAEQTAAADPASAISVAVLPFLNLSGDANQEFFSDGMTEEITAALAKVPDLKVVARTSAFRFRGQMNDMRTVGQALNATHLIEGSVRKEGDRVRITAQLIEVGKGTHLWSESYDRKLSDIFATQEEIARTIVSSLMTPLGLAPGERLVSNRTIGPESYEEYLRAKALVRARGLTSMTDAAALMEQVVSRNPDYAPGWALLAQAYHFTPTYHPARNRGDIEEYRRVVNASLPKAEAAARRAIQLAPNDADGYSALGYVQQVRGHPQVAEELYSKALVLDPNNSDALHLDGLLLAEMGRLKEALSARQKLQALDPFVPVYNTITALVLWLNGQTDSAMALLKDIPAGAGGEGVLALIFAQEGRYREAADAMPPPSSRLFYPGLTDEAARLLRMAPMDAPSPKTLPRLGLMSWVYLYVGQLDRALEFYEGNAEVGFFLGGIVSPLWDASYAPLRKTERFRAYARKSGMVEYWRAKGWPEFCRPTTGDNFVCD